jgi:hypothetical protein
VTVFYLILLVVAFVLFVLATFNVASRINLVAAGLALWVLVPLLQILRAVT